MAEEPSLLVERQGHIATITLNRPDALNALNRDLSGRLLAAARELADDADARVVVVRGVGDRAFCVGADLKERRELSIEETRWARTTIAGAIRAVNFLPQPTIVAVQGFALGGGFELALACDLIVAAETSSFGLPEVTLGIIPGAGGTQNLPRRIGRAFAKELIFTGRRFDATEAFRLGIVNRVVPAADLERAALELARQIAANAPLALRQAKRAIDVGVDADLATGLAFEYEAYNLCLLTEDRLEGLRAFAERRPPQYQGR